MRVSQLRIRHFRNIKDVELLPHSTLNILVGENGQGKTSFIEAIHFLSSLKSFRTGKTLDLVEKGQNGFLVEALVDDSSKMTTQLKVRIVEKTRSLHLDEKIISASQFTGRLRAVVFSPESLASVKAGPEGRRDLIDTALLQLSQEAARAQRDFSKALRQRNSCLKNMKEGALTEKAGADILESLEPLYLHAATRIIKERLDFLDKIFLQLPEIMTRITGQKVDLDFHYSSSSESWTERSEGAIFDRLCGELKSPQRVRAEKAVGTTLTGPHRHQITFLFNENDSRIFCSQGQQRAVILAFKIAEIVYHSEAFRSYPLLLLDDVLSEFDEAKRQFLINFLKQSQAQTFLTTTDQNVDINLNETGSTIFKVNEGQFTKNGH